MSWVRVAGFLVSGVAIVLAAGCGSQPSRLVMPQTTDGTGGSSLVSRMNMGDDLGPTICFFNSSFEYCYPTPGYLPFPEREVPVTVRAGAPVTMSWTAHATPGRSIRKHRWTVDIEDLLDDTPRIDEDTDLSHWSAWSATASVVTLGPWSDGEVHKLYVDVEDDMGWRSLGIVRFEVQAGVNSPPDCSGALAQMIRTWPPNHQLEPVTITGVTDPDGDPVTITVTGISQDEPVNGAGDGDTCPDATIVGGAARVRVERSGNGNGRVYTIAFTAADGFGGMCSGSVDVCVPHDGGGGACVKDAMVTSSLGPCEDCGPRRPKKR